MVFQKPNPFPKSIYENVAYGLRLQGVRNRRTLDEAVEKSLRKAALANNDAALCNNIRKADDQVDDLLKEIFAWAQGEIPKHVEATPAVLNLLSIARKLERIADMTTNIAEDVIFIASGEVVRHDR